MEKEEGRQALPQALRSAGGLERFPSKAGLSVVARTFAMIAFIALVWRTLGLGITFARRAWPFGAVTGIVKLPEQDAAGATATKLFNISSFPDVANVEPGMISVSAVVTKSLSEIYVSQTGGSGVEGVVNLSVFGPDTWTSYGDAFVPLYRDSSYTPNPWWDELEGKYTFRVLVPPDYPDPFVQVEILDPDCYNVPNPGDGMVEVEYVQTGEKHLRSLPSGASRQDGCLVPTQDPCQNPLTGEPCNPYWFLRMDENRVRFGRPRFYRPSSNTTTRYTLYYLSEGDNVKHTIASYTKGGADSDADTDLQWVTPEGFRFRLSDYPTVASAEDGSRSFFLEVEPTAGSSENGFDLWAGPVSTYPVPKEVNARNVYLLREGLDRHDSGGIVITGIGYLPLNVNADAAFTFTLNYIPLEAAGAEVRVYNFDTDYPYLGQNLDFYLEGVPDFHEVGVLSRGNEWATSRFQIPEEFSGGYLWARYDSTEYDTSTWRLELEYGVPESSQYSVHLPLMLKNH